jgi:D-sedoheptulose 7-phosphate isomerase
MQATGNYIDTLRSMFDASIRAKQRYLADDSRLAAFARVTRRVVSCYRQGGRLYLAGNGGSAADAQHIAAEFVCRFAMDRNPLPAEALTVDASVMTAIGNDYGFDQVFARQLRAKLGPADLFIGISTSGNSPNIVEALRVCRDMGRGGILLSGGQGGSAAELADELLLAADEVTNRIQETHILILHALCVCVERELNGL